MRIISKFHDYYDGIQSVGYDPHLTYHRVQHDLRIGLKNKDFYRKYDSSDFVMPEGLPSFSESFLIHVNPRNNYGLRDTRFMTSDGYLYLIGFCGKYYLTLRESVRNRDYTSTVEFLYDKDSAVRFFSTYHNKNVHKSVFDVLGECSVSPFSDPLEPFRVLNAPVFCIELRDKYSIFVHGKELTVNPELDSMQFYRMFDAYSAYQEIAMFLSGVLGWPENATVQISDEDMRDAKGFDKWSFKTMPTKRKRV